MRIGLIDLDRSHFPNIPLMKLSAYHKSKGDSVEWYDPMFSEWMDVVYVAKVFTWTKDFEYDIRADKVIKGGIGYGIGNDNKLPDEIEHIYPDYELYGITDTAYGFLSRGCPRQCSFCNVSEHQGKISRKVANLNEFWSGQKNIVLLDPNILASSEWKPILNDLVESGSMVDFTQGLDIRFMTEEKVEYVNKIRVSKLHFAWDNYEMKTLDMLTRFRPLITHHWVKLRVYVLVNYNTTFDQDLFRIYKLRELKYEPYVMIYDKHNASRQYRRLSRWVNSRMVWRNVERFEDYTS